MAVYTSCVGLRWGAPSSVLHVSTTASRSRFKCDATCNLRHAQAAIAIVTLCIVQCSILVLPHWGSVVWWLLLPSSLAKTDSTLSSASTPSVDFQSRVEANPDLRLTRSCTQQNYVGVGSSSGNVSIQLLSRREGIRGSSQHTSLKGAFDSRVLAVNLSFQSNCTIKIQRWMCMMHVY